LWGERGGGENKQKPTTPPLHHYGGGGGREHKTRKKKKFKCYIISEVLILKKFFVNIGLEVGILAAIRRRGTKMQAHGVYVENRGGLGQEDWG